MAERFSLTPEELRKHVDALEEALVGIHGFVTGAMARADVWDDADVRETFSHIQAQVERVLPEVLELKAMIEKPGDIPDDRVH